MKPGSYLTFWGVQYILILSYKHRTYMYNRENETSTALNRSFKVNVTKNTKFAKLMSQKFHVIRYILVPLSLHKPGARTGEVNWILLYRHLLSMDTDILQWAVSSFEMKRYSHIFFKNNLLHKTLINMDDRLFLCHESQTLMYWQPYALLILVSYLALPKPGGGGRVLAEKLGRGVRPASQNPYPIYD